MCKAIEMDRLFFEGNTSALIYQRAPESTEWAGIALPDDALVAVFKITDRCRVRALQNSQGERIAEPIIDVDTITHERMDREQMRLAA